MTTTKGVFLFHPSCPCPHPPVTVPTKMSKRMERGVHRSCGDDGVGWKRGQVILFDEHRRVGVDQQGRGEEGRKTEQN